jgi:hypothetical protein
METSQLEDYLETLEIHPTKTVGQEVWAKCPGHLARTGHEDRNPSWSINASTGAHRCWSCNFKGSFPFLIAYVTGVSVEDVKNGEAWISQSATGLTKAFESLLKEPETEVIETLQESSMALFTYPPLNALKSRGITAESCRECEILWDPRRELWILPIREPRTNKLYGWQEKSYVGRYFNNYPKGVKKGHTLFNFNNWGHAKTRIIVESPLDVARLYSVGYPNAIAAYGAGLTKEQKQELASVEHLMLAFDNDDAGRSCTLDLLKWARGINKGVWVFNYAETDQKDVGGMSKVEIQTGIENAKFSAMMSI